MSTKSSGGSPRSDLPAAGTGGHTPPQKEGAGGRKMTRRQFLARGRQP